MPKETIRPQVKAKQVVEVQWGRESGIVQLASVNLDKEQFSEGRGWFVDMNRESLNHLIRTLRRARDGAFGKDE